MIIIGYILSIMYGILLGCVLYSINKFQINKLKRNSNPINRVQFYVARDKNSFLYLYLGKPKRADFYFMPCKDGYCFVDIRYFRKFGLNPDDFKDLKFEDEPVEVFLNLKD